MQVISMTPEKRDPRRHQLSRLAAAGLFVIGVLSGCLGPATSPPAIVAPPLERVTAEYQLSDGATYRATFDGPRRAMDRDGEFRMAYFLFIISLENPEARQTTFLDSSLHEVRSDGICQRGGSSAVCQYQHVRWQTQGGLPPWGFGLLWHLHRSPTIAYGLWDQAYSTTPTVKFDKGEIQVSIVDYARPSTKGLVRVQSSYVFLPGELLPVRFNLSLDENAPTLGERVKYERHGLLDPADEWPKAMSRPTPNPRTGFMFPGEEGDDFQSGHSHREALDWLLEASTEARSAMERGGCVVNYRVAPGTNPPNGLDPLKPVTTDFMIAVLNADGKGKRWYFSRSDSALGSSYGTPNGEPVDRGAPCKEFGRSPRPVLSSADFFEIARNVQVNHSGTPWFVWGQEQDRLFSGSPETGWDEYAFQYTPAYVSDGPGVASYAPYSLLVDANHGWWEYMNVHPDDVKRMGGL